MSVGGDCCLGEDGGEREAEGGDSLVGLEMVGEGELVEDVVFGGLDYEEDALRKSGGGFGGTVGGVGACEAG